MEQFIVCATGYKLHIRPELIHAFILFSLFGLFHFVGCVHAACEQEISSYFGLYERM